MLLPGFPGHAVAPLPGLACECLDYPSTPHPITYPPKPPKEEAPRESTAHRGLLETGDIHHRPLTPRMLRPAGTEFVNSVPTSSSFNFFFKALTF